MATIKAETLNNRIYAGGAHGNLSVALGRVVLAAAAVSDVVEVLEIPAGMKFIGIKLVTESGLTAGVTVTAKVDDKTLIANANMAAAGASASAICVPYRTTAKTKLTVTITAATVSATGDLNVIPEYVAEGY